MPGFRKIYPLIAFVLFGSVAVMLWQNQNSHQQELVFRHTETSAEQIKIRVEGFMKARTASLELMAERWVERTPPDFSQRRFFEFAERFYEHYPGFVGINWVDPDGVVRWVFPYPNNIGVIGQNVSRHWDSRARNIFDRAGEHLTYAVTPVKEIVQGGLGFDAFWPLIYNGKMQGYLNAVFRIRQVMDICLAKDILENFRVSLYEDGRLIYTSEKQNRNRPPKNCVGAMRELRFPEKLWRLELVPKTVIYPDRNIPNISILMFGLAISAILSLLLHFLIQRMQMYRQARDHALQEVSERKRAEEALKQKERQLKELLAELAAKNTELEAFIYSVSHDLRTPIVTIEGFVGALREDFGDCLTADGEKHLNFIGDAARKMEALIDDLLELSRIGRVTVQKIEFPFVDAVEEALKVLQPRIQEKGVQVSVMANLPMVYAEKKRLVQVMENLLSNAVKYVGKENPAPRIEVGVQKTDGRKVFFVEDNGIGIEKVYFEKIFEVFQRLPDAKRIGEGTGIGLAIVKRIVEHHGGSIWLQSEPGKGTTFFFTLKDKEAGA